MHLSEFMQSLRTTQVLGKWYTIDGALRLQHGECTFCPITATHFMRTGEIIRIDDYHDAAQAMQLDPALIRPLVDAADGHVDELNELLYDALLEVTIG